MDRTDQGAGVSRILKHASDAGTALRLPMRVARSERDSDATAAPTAAPVVPDAAAIEAQLKALRERALREGYEQGRAQAEKDVRSAIEAGIAQCRQGLEKIEAAVVEKLQSVEPMAVAIGFHAMAVVLGRSYAERDAIVGAVRQLLAGTAESSLTLNIQISPTQLERVRAALEHAPVPSARRLQFEADPALSDAECRVVSDRGRLETGLALQLQAVQDALLRAHQVRGASKDAR